MSTFSHFIFETFIKICGVPNEIANNGARRLYFGFSLSFNGDDNDDDRSQDSFWINRSNIMELKRELNMWSSMVDND